MVESRERIRSWKSLIRVQEQAVVSRTLVKNPAGSVTLFAMDEGETISEHRNPHEAVLWVLEGRLALTLAGRTYTLADGDLVVMRPHEPHALRAEKPVRFLLVMLKPPSRSPT